jgi:hypothetical protein
MSKSSDTSLAEQLLFPPHNELENSSEEESDWIVSDGEDAYVDLKLMLSERGMVDEKILYHPEVQAGAGRGEGRGSEDAFVADKELEEILSSPLIEAVCREEGDGGVEAVREVIKTHGSLYELDAIDDKGERCCKLNIILADLCKVDTFQYHIEAHDSMEFK